MGVVGIIKALDRRGRRAVKLVTANLIHVTQLIHKKVKVNTDKFYYTGIIFLKFRNWIYINEKDLYKSFSNKERAKHNNGNLFIFCFQ